MANFLTRLELQGFKSFAPKTTLDFNERVVGIVGPNGSGKSNIIDAIRWALGEREAKNLRGEVLENLIFAGTPKKSASSVARVTLYFNNSADTLPVDGSEVAVSRRTDRSGTSQFFVNGKEVRLKNLIPMLAKARLGSRGLTIIGQGQSDVFVRITPEERRAVIEEILGLKEYRLKKKTAHHRLRRSNTNIRTVRAKLEELAPHRRFLNRQKRKWDRRTEIADELKKLATQYFSVHYSAVAPKLVLIESELGKLDLQKKEKEKEVEVVEKRLDEARKTPKDGISAREIRDKIKEQTERRTQIGRELARVEAHIELKKAGDKTVNDHGTLLRHIQDFLAAAKKVVSEKNEGRALTLLSVWSEKLSSVINVDSSESFEDERRCFEIGKAVAELDKEINKLHEREELLMTAREERNEEFRGHVEELETKKDELRTIERKVQEQAITKERIGFRVQELQSRWQSLGFSLEELNGLGSDDSSSKEDWQKTERRIDRLRGELAAIGEIDEVLIKEAGEVEERYGHLSGELKDLEKAANDLDRLIAELDKKIHEDFKRAFGKVNEELNKYFRLMFGGGKARLRLAKKEIEPSENGEADEEVADELENVEDPELTAGVEISVLLPRKKITSLEMLSGGEKSLVSIAALFALISVSPPPFLVLDEIDAALDDENSRRFAELIREFADTTQFIIITHNRVTMEAIGALYGITMGEDGVSKVLSLKLKEAEAIAE